MINRRDGNVHTCVFDKHDNLIYWAKIRWDSNFVFKDGLVGGWEIISMKSPSETDWNEHHRGLHLTWREDFEWEDYG